MTDLLKLAERVEAGETATSKFIDDLAVPFGYRPSEFMSDYRRFHLVRNSIRKALNGSLDSAKALHEAVLPGWWYGLMTYPDKGVSRWNVGPGGDLNDVYSGEATSQPASWVAAILRAKHADGTS